MRNVFKLHLIGIGMIKRKVFGLYSLISAVLFSGLVSAFNGYDIQYFVQNILDGMAQVAAPLFGAAFGYYETTEFLFVKILVFILLFVVIKTAVKATPRLGENNMVTIVISLVVSILAIRFMSENDFFRGILLPYGSLGVALATLLPFLIYGFFVHKSFDTGSIRKAAFIFYIIVFGIIWISRYDEINQASNYIYAGTLILAICLMLFDRQVKAYFRRNELERVEEDINANSIARATIEYTQALEALRTSPDNTVLKRFAEKKRRHLRSLGADI